MADPLLARGIRAQVVLPGKSALPEDRFITTWAFQSAGQTATEADETDVANQLIEFFNIPASPSTRTVAGLISAAVNRDGCEVRTYRMADAPPRPVTITPFTLGPPEQQTTLPEEVAVTLSFFSLRNVPRQRGRVFIGPLHGGVISNDAESRSVVDTADRNAIRNAAIRLATTAPLEADWCVLSKVNGVLYPITNGWVDNAFDTQRRRGQKATVRDVWAAPAS